MERAQKVGDSIRNNLREQLGNSAGLSEIRGMGSMIGIELARPCGELVLRTLEAGLVLNVTADNVVRMLPPLNIEQSHVEEAAGALEAACAGLGK